MEQACMSYNDDDVDIFYHFINFSIIVIFNILSNLSIIFC